MTDNLSNKENVDKNTLVVKRNSIIFRNFCKREYLKILLYRVILL